MMWRAQRHFDMCYDVCVCVCLCVCVCGHTIAKLFSFISDKAKIPWLVSACAKKQNQMSTI